ncbi:MAG: hypothetical protein C5B53_10260 [Candidatus Melainabacteria bacterium]|nr:MAG: hypothetical protein C5B53_10260 [Candidatus Melainabacteria bacterium]
MDQIIPIITSSCLFDSDWYLKEYPEVVQAGVNALEDYLRVGAALGRDPNPLFSTAWYRLHNPDVAAAGINPLEHYIRWGALEGRDPNAMFDTAWYFEQNPEVRLSGANPLEHYITVGAPSGRNPNFLFDANWYVQRYPDVLLTGLSALAHYLRIGAAEHRDASPLFDSKWYLQKYPDIAECGLNPFEHYLRWGTVERRDPNPMFDSTWYLQRHPNVADSGTNPLEHYLRWGAAQGLDPNSMFDTDWYLEQNPDVAEAGINPLVHYLTRGRAEGRTANPWSQKVSISVAKTTEPGLNCDPKIYVYTAVLGEYDELPSIAHVDPRITYLAFTDTAITCPPPWSIVPVDNIFRDRKVTSGFLKANPELLFEQDSIVIWVDGNLRDLCFDCEAILAWLKDGPVAAPPHLIREKIEAEKTLMEFLSVEDRISASRLWHQMRDLGFKDDQGLSATLLLARDLRDSKVRAADRFWWDAILNGARRDQLSFNYALWAAGLTCNPIDIDWRHTNPVFSVIHHKHTNGRTVDRKPFDAESAENISWRALSLPDLPNGYPAPALFHPEWWSSHALETIRLINQAVLESDEPLEGNYCYFHQRPVHPRTPPDPRRSWKREVLRRATGVGQTALELGFNAGHSAVVMLDANPCLQLTSIDIGLHGYTRACAEIIASRYPGRFRFLLGATRELLPSLELEHKLDFEIIHVDGGHSPDDVRFDFDFVLRNAPGGCTIVMDDAYVPHIKDLIGLAELNGYLKVAHLSLPATGENRVFIRTGKLFTEARDLLPVGASSVAIRPSPGYSQSV